MFGMAKNTISLSTMSFCKNPLKTYCLLACSFALAFLLTSSARTAEAAVAAAPEYRLRLFHTHTGERIDIVYRRGDTYDPEALAELNHYLRDHRTGAVLAYDPRVFDLLHDLDEDVHFLREFRIFPEAVFIMILHA